MARKPRCPYCKYTGPYTANNGWHRQVNSGDVCWDESEQLYGHQV